MAHGTYENERAGTTSSKKRMKDLTDKVKNVDKSNVIKGTREVTRFRDKETGERTKLVTRQVKRDPSMGGMQQHGEWKQTTRGKGIKGKKVTGGEHIGGNGRPMQIMSMSSGTPVYDSSGEGRTWGGRKTYDEKGNYRLKKRKRGGWGAKKK